MTEINKQYMERKGIEVGMPIEILGFNDDPQVGYYGGFEKSHNVQMFVLINHGNYRQIMLNSIKDVKKLIKVE